MINAVSRKYEDALLKMARQRSTNLMRLSEHWPALERKILKQRWVHSSHIAGDDPIRAPIDLLSPIKRTSDETIHTRALAYLLNPYEAHDLGKDVLSAVLMKLPGRRGAAKIAALLGQKRVRVDVFPEYRYSIENSKTRSVARNDIRIELRSNQDQTAALIIIENKIEAPEGKGQLDWYQAEARKWCKENQGQALLVYVAPEERDGTLKRNDWLHLSYLDLASALRHVWERRRSASGHSWLGLYISAITSGVLGIDINRLQDTTIEEIDTYLGKPWR